MGLTEPAATIRASALQAATALWLGINGAHLPLDTPASDLINQAETEIRGIADTFAAWATGTVTLHLTAGPVVDQTTGAPAPPAPQEGDRMQIHDNEKFALTADTRDAKGFPTSDPLEWTVDGDAVVTLSVSEDGRTCTVIAVAPGSAVITVTDGVTAPVLTATEAVDVVPGGTALITLAEGPAEPQ